MLTLILVVGFVFTPLIARTVRSARPTTDRYGFRGGTPRNSEASQTWRSS